MTNNVDLFIENFKKQLDTREEHEVFEPNTIFRELDSWDSISALMVLSMIEEEYGVVLTSENLLQLNTIADLYNFILCKQ